VEFHLLGPLEVVHDGERLALGGPRQRTVLAALMVRANQVVSIDQLAEAVWQRPPASWRSNVRTYVASLRGGLGDRVARSREGYRLVVETGELDVSIFDELADRAAEDYRSGDIDAAEAGYRRALELWRGPALAGLPLGPLLEIEASRLDERRLCAVERRVEIQTQLGVTDDVIAELGALADEHPFRERLTELLMLALNESGRRAEAIEAYRRTRERVVAALGVELSPQLRRRYQDIVAGTRPARPVRTVGIPAELPAAVAAFTGRGDQLDQLERLLDRSCDSAVVAVVSGMAGVGKTALAAYWGHRAADRFPDGQLFLDLGGFGAGRPVTAREALGRLLPALGMPAERVPSEQGALVAAFRSATAGRRMLIVLDNARGTEQVRPLFPGHAGSLVLVTSRDTMAGLVAVDGAHPVPLEPLAPAESLCLLNRIIADDRVRTERSAVSELAQLCGHLPLALRLAAARLSTQPRHTVRSMVTRIRDHDPLASLWVPGDPQSAVRLAFDHSYLALDGSHRCLLRRLALPPGPDVTVPVAAAILDNTVDAAEPMLEALVAANLVDEHMPGRYRLHDLIRHYAAGRADLEDGPLDREAAIRRVLVWYLHTADDASRILDPHRRRTVQVEPGMPNRWPLRFAGYAQALAWCEAERANLVAAVAVAGERGLDELAWQFPVSLYSFLELRKYWQDWIFTHQIGLASARRIGTAAGEAWMLNSLGIAHKQLGRRDRAMRYQQQALALRRATGDRHGEAICSNNLGTIANETGRQDEAIAHYEHALAIFQESGDRWGEAMALSNLGECHRALDALDAAANCYRDALIIRRELADRRGVGVVLHNIAETLYARGQHAEAVVHYQQALVVRREVGDRWGVARTLTNLGRALDQTGDPAAARLCWRQALAIFRDLGDPQAPAVEHLLRAPMSSTHAAGPRRDAGNRTFG
jgi:DNA-binding SARP family transcriptional activator/tetratricopeptide (TPR) repeat protein